MKLARWLIKTTVCVTAAASLLMVPACQPTRPIVERIEQQGELIVATQIGPTTYYNELSRETGFEYELARSFANYLGVELKVKTYTDLGELLSAVKTGKVHFAAAGLTETAERSQQFRFSSPYQQITQQLIYHTGAEKPKKLEDLVGKKLVVIANSSHSENLSNLQQQIPELTWEEKKNTTVLTLLNMVNDHLADYVIVDSNVFLTYREIFPELRSAFDIKGSEPLAWAFNPTEDASLYTMSELFLAQANESGELEDLRIRFFGHQKFDYVGARTFLSHYETRLSKYQEEFKRNAKDLNLDWRLLAAIGYQESLWNPNAISPTGVRGLMMLTLRTAKEMGIDNRRDATQSIVGGSKYFKKLYQRLPESIQEPNRTWYALAAYNVGYGHLMDARRLARAAGEDPNDWFVVRKHLPNLMRHEYFSKTRYGYARAGREAVGYVRNIRRYYEALVWATERENHRYSPTPQNLVAMRDALVH